MTPGRRSSSSVACLTFIRSKRHCTTSRKTVLSVLSIIWTNKAFNRVNLKLRLLIWTTVRTTSIRPISNSFSTIAFTSKIDPKFNPRHSNSLLMTLKGFTNLSSQSTTTTVKWPSMQSPTPQMINWEMNNFSWLYLIQLGENQ